MQNKYQYASLRSLDSSSRRDDLFSEALSWLGGRPLLFFVVLLVCLLLLSAACEQAIASADSVSAAAPPEIAQGEDTAVAHLNPVTQPDAIAPQSESDAQSSLPHLLAGGLAPDLATERWIDTVMTLAFRLSLAAMLGAAVAFRPRRTLPRLRSSPYVLQTQILIAVVAAALMMIVGDSAARAFGIFAAASLVRFRTNIQDPKETTVLLVNLGIGLAAGVGRWELACMFALFVLVLLRILEGYADHQALRWFELSVRTQNVEATDEAVRGMFRRNNLDCDVREVNKESEKHPIGKVVYSLEIKPNLNTERLAEEISLADPTNIERIEWHRKKAASYA